MVSWVDKIVEVNEGKHDDPRAEHCKDDSFHKTEAIEVRDCGLGCYKQRIANAMHQRGPSRGLRRGHSSVKRRTTHTRCEGAALDTKEEER